MARTSGREDCALQSPEFASQHCPVPCLGWSGKNPSSGGIGSQLVQQSIFRSAADDANLLDASPADVFQIAKNKTVFQGQAFQNRSHVGSRVLRGWAGAFFVQNLSMAVSISRGARKDSSSGSTRCAKAGLLSPPVPSIRDSRRSLPCAVQDCRQHCSIHSPITFFKQSRRSVHAAFIGEIQIATLRG